FLPVGDYQYGVALVAVVTRDAGAVSADQVGDDVDGGQCGRRSLERQAHEVGPGQAGAVVDEPCFDGADAGRDAAFVDAVRIAPTAGKPGGHDGERRPHLR